MDKELKNSYEKRYKSTGPLRCHLVDLVVSVKGNELVRVNLEHEYLGDTMPYTDAQEVNVVFNTVAIFDLYDLIHNDVLMNNINLDNVKKMINKIEHYYTWLHTVYEPKFEDKIEQFFYQVFLWIKEDLHEFCLYTGATLDIEYNFKVDENYELIEKDGYITKEHILN